jgi:tetratricopeptide (TPR) repeat protein
MGRIALRLNCFVAALCAAAAISGAAAAQDAGSDRVAQLLEQLAKPDQPGWEQIEEQIRQEWSRSGSPSIDLLLQRGLDALEADDIPAALDHLTALTDHAPDFAEGWNLRATAHFRAERYGLALEDIRRVLALNPQHYVAMTGLAIILEELGMEAEALEVLRKVVAINPHRPDVTEALERLERAVQGKAI